jgi:hypothetical protein
MNLTPSRFAHSCPYCVYLGEYRSHDLYFCNGHGSSLGGEYSPIVLTRFGNNTQDVIEIPIALVTAFSVDSVRRARGRAVTRGLWAPGETASASSTDKVYLGDALERLA